VECIRVAIVGSRDYPDLDAVKCFVEKLPPDSVVISGGARGVDRIAETYARQRGLKVIVFPADWDRHGKRAGVIRNFDIVNASDIIVAFWDGKSKGTQHTINIAKQQGKQVVIYSPNGGDE
jgi:predicted Rossmann fold nucleotide-binding protein DprA/Smf involved in DNA uptake